MLSRRGSNEQFQSAIQKQALLADRNEQYSRRDSLRLSGIPHPPDENDDTLIKAVTDIAKAMLIDINKDDIDVIHRVGKATISKPRQVLCKFAHRKPRDTQYKSKSKLKNTSVKGQIYINEDYDCPPQSTVGC